MIRGTLAFIAVFGLVTGTPAASVAQEYKAGKVPRIGILNAGNLDHLDERIPNRLSELGYTEGQSIVIERRYAEGKAERLRELAAELVRLKVDLIVTMGVAATQAAQTATKTIPIVMVSAGDPVQSGFVASLARPGGNITGTSYAASLGIIGKTLELLKEAVPDARRIAVLWNPNNPAHEAGLQEVKAVGRALGVKLQPLEARGPDQFDSVFSAMTAQRPDALLVVQDVIFRQHRERLVSLAAKHRLPSMHGSRDFPEAGALMAYGPNLHDRFLRAAAFVDKILRGAKPAELPVEQPSKFELVINLKTAKALGLTIPQSILVRADEILQ